VDVQPRRIGELVAAALQRAPEPESTWG